jgi:hypothetical protein
MSYSVNSFGAIEPCPNEGEVRTADGFCMTPEQFDRIANERLAHLPPPCNDINNMRAMYQRVGVATARPGDPPDKMQQAAIDVLSWCQARGIDCRDDEAVCAELVKQTGGGEPVPTAIIVLLGAGVVGVAALAYITLRK